jgi:hypothetical protein
MELKVFTLSGILGSVNHIHTSIVFLYRFSAQRFRNKLLIDVKAVYHGTPFASRWAIL